MIKVGINGFGRIGRCIARAIYDNGLDNKIQISQINGSKIDTMAHLLKYDSVHGRFNANVSVDEEGKTIRINNNKINATHTRELSDIKWNNDIDIIFECTGKFNSVEKSATHIESNPHIKAVIISAPIKDGHNIVYKVNDNTMSKADNIFSIGSCTTNCLAPLCQALLNANVDIQSGFMTTIHSYTGDQNILDGSHKSDIRRARSAAMSMVPTSTGAANAIGKVIPQLQGKLHGSAVRVPTANVSMVDFTFLTSKHYTIKEINDFFLHASQHELSGVLCVESDKLVSVDFNHTNHSSIIDSHETNVIGKLVRVVSWYDNEWSFAVRMLDMAQKYMAI